VDAGAAWWIDDRIGFDFFPDIQWPADGLLGPRYGMRAILPVSGFTVAEDAKLHSAFDVRVEIAGAVFSHRVGPFQFRREDPVRGEVRRTMAPVHAVSLLFDRTQELVRANEAVDRVIRLRVRSYSSRRRSVRLRFSIPPGLAVAELPDTMTLAPLEVRDISLHVKGRVPEDRHPLTVYADEGRHRYVAGYFTLGYDHIRPIVLKRSSGLWVKGVRVAIAENRGVVYVPGVADDVGAILSQLDVPVSIVEPERFGSFDLAPFQTVVLGPRVYSRFPGLAAYNARLVEFARQGGTVVVQYGQHEMAAPGMLPYPIELEARPQRVTIEQAPVRILDPAARVLNAPNPITAQDFGGWTQERALYMPARADTAWRPLLEMNDPDEPPNRNSVLIARVGRGSYVYTTLSFFRQVTAGVDGAIRLFVNLLGSSLPGR
jgi:hypothetical protein